MTDDRVAWTLWVPRPDIPMPVSGTRGSVQVRGPVATEHGTMQNLTGQGTAAVNFNVRRTVFSVGGFYVEGRVNLSAGDGTGAYWVWRQTDDPLSHVSVGGVSEWTGERLGEKDGSCGGDAYFMGDAAQGWTLVPRQFSDCIGTIGLLPWDIAAVTLLAVGGALSIAAAGFWIAVARLWISGRRSSRGRMRGL